MRGFKNQFELKFASGTPSGNKGLHNSRDDQRHIEFFYKICKM